MQAVMEICFREYCAGDARAFRALNEQWITKYFVLEEKDIETLNDPDTHILGSGGHIYFATMDDVVVGCCALIANGHRSFEVAKMAVSEVRRNQGIGKALLAHVIEQARALGARRLTLETNSTLKNAIHVYELMGFVHRDPAEIEVSPYQRADVHMEMAL